jgi:hypothetical protein
MIVSYLLYKMQQRDSAAAAAAASAAATNAEDTAQQQDAYLAELPSIDTGGSTTTGYSDVSAGTTSTTVASDPNLAAILDAYFPSSTSTTTYSGNPNTGAGGLPTVVSIDPTTIADTGTAQPNTSSSVAPSFVSTNNGSSSIIAPQNGSTLRIVQ